MSEKFFVQGGDLTHALKAYNEINPLLYRLSYQAVAHLECNSTLVQWYTLTTLCDISPPVWFNPFQVSTTAQILKNLYHLNDLR